MAWNKLKQLSNVGNIYSSLPFDVLNALLYKMLVMSLQLYGCMEWNKIEHSNRREIQNRLASFLYINMMDLGRDNPFDKYEELHYTAQQSSTRSVLSWYDCIWSGDSRERHRA